jgi:hypothetical protein
MPLTAGNRLAIAIVDHLPATDVQLGGTLAVNRRR